MKPPAYKDFEEWYFNMFNIDLSAKPSTVFEYVSSKLKKDLTESEFWKEFIYNLSNYNDEYYLDHNYPLMKISETPISLKSYESFLNKTYRKNILNNKNFPKAPNNGWITHENWFSQINDLLRTSITVRYLDGVKFIVEKIEALSKKHSLNFSVDFEAREEGYYAAHITLNKSFEIVDLNWNKKEIDVPIEIQITTQLQEVIKGLLHKMYEQKRIEIRPNIENKWQWDYKSLEFSSNYLGHILHYVEGMILEVRDKQKETKS